MNSSDYALYHNWSNGIRPEAEASGVEPLRFSRMLGATMKNVFQCVRVGRRMGSASVLDGVSLHAAPGEVVLLAGGGGAGKSTLLRILAGLEQPDSGTVFVDGVEAAAVPPRLRRIAWLPARDTLWPHLDATENIVFTLRNDGMPAEDAVRTAREVLLSLSLEHCAARLPGELSGDERQRLVLARAMASEPRLFLLDDAFGTCAPRARERLLGFVKKHAVASHAAVVLATTDPAPLFPFADRIAVLDGGQILQEGAPLVVYRRPVNRRVVEILAPETNIIEGELLHAGAGEFLARTPLGELRGALETPGEEPPAGTAMDIFLRPECLHADVFAPDENAFAASLPSPDSDAAGEGASVSSEYRGATAMRLYRTAGGISLRVLETNPGTVAARSSASAPVFLWIAPEDLIGVPRPHG